MRSPGPWHRVSGWQGKAQGYSGTGGGLGLVFNLGETAGNPVLTLP